MEGFLPVAHAAGWTAIAVPFWGVGLWRLSRSFRERPQEKLLLGAVGGFTFALSALKLPSVTGSSSHATGTGLGGVLFGPWIMSVLGTVVLLFQALFLAHGGLTTLGANSVSMAVVGGFTAWGIHRICIGCGIPGSGSVFLAACLSDLATYCTTSFQLALAFPDPASGAAGSFMKFLGIFGFTQIPLAVCEGLLSVFVLNLLGSRGILPESGEEHGRGRVVA